MRLRRETDAYNHLRLHLFVYAQNNDSALIFASPTGSTAHLQG